MTAVIFLHFISLPVVVCGAVDINSDENSGRVVFGLFYIAIIKKRIDVQRVKRALHGDNVEQKQEDAHESKKQKKPHPFLLRLGKNLLTVMRVRVFELHALIGLGDAAATAVSVGACRVAAYNLYNVLGYKHGVADITADYESETLSGSFVGIISLCIADIIYAAVKALFIRRAVPRSRRHYENTVTE